MVAIKSVTAMPYSTLASSTTTKRATDGSYAS